MKKSIASFSPCGGVGTTTLASTLSSHYQDAIFINFDGEPLCGVLPGKIANPDRGLMVACRDSEDYTPIMDWLQSADVNIGEAHHVVMDISVIDINLVKALASAHLVDMVIMPVTDDMVTWGATEQAACEFENSSIPYIVVPSVRFEPFDYNILKEEMCLHHVRMTKNIFRLNRDNSNLFFELEEAVKA